MFGKRFADRDSNPAAPREGDGSSAAGGCGSRLTGQEMRAHFTECPNRPAALPQVNSLDGRGRNSKAKRGRPPGRRMLCGWRCGAPLTASHMRTHFTHCPRQPWGLKGEKCAPGARGDAGRCRVRADSQYRNGGIYVKAPSLFLKKRHFSARGAAISLDAVVVCGELPPDYSIRKMGAVEVFHTVSENGQTL